MKKSQNKKEYYVIKINKRRIDWLIKEDSTFRSCFTLLTELATILGFVIAFIVFASN